MTAALVPISQSSVLPSPADWRTMLDMAGALVASGLLPAHIKTRESAVAIMQKGAELGIAPMYAMSSIVVINGKPTANSELMLAIIYRDHGDDAIHITETTAKSCTVSYKRRGWAHRQLSTFTIEEARAANLVKTGPWTTYPAAMLRARCISAVARMAFPDSIGGMYSAEEMGAAVQVSDEGEVSLIDASGTVIEDVAVAPTAPKPVLTEDDIATKGAIEKWRHQAQLLREAGGEIIDIPDGVKVGVLRGLKERIEAGQAAALAATDDAEEWV